MRDFYANTCLFIHAGTLVCSVVMFIVHWPLIVSEKVNSCPNQAVIRKDGHVCTRRVGPQFINFT